MKDDVGKAKPCSVKLPPNDFAFGRADRKETYGVGAITSHWEPHVKSKGAAPVRDFRKINKYTINNNN